MSFNPQARTFHQSPTSTGRYRHHRRHLSPHPLNHLGGHHSQGYRPPPPAATFRPRSHSFPGFDHAELDRDAFLTTLQGEFDRMSFRRDAGGRGRAGCNMRGRGSPRGRGRVMRMSRGRGEWGPDHPHLHHPESPHMPHQHHFPTNEHHSHHHKGFAYQHKVPREENREKDSAPSDSDVEEGETVLLSSSSSIVGDALFAKRDGIDQLADHLDGQALRSRLMHHRHRYDRREARGHPPYPMSKAHHLSGIPPPPAPHGHPLRHTLREGFERENFGSRPPNPIRAFTSPLIFDVESHHTHHRMAKPNQSNTMHTNARPPHFGRCIVHRGRSQHEHFLPFMPNIYV